jgi:hypothetical protein
MKMFNKLYISKVQLTIILIVGWLFCFSQVQLGIYNNTIAVVPSYTVTDGTSITASGQIINTGSTNVSGTIILQMAVNTSTTASPSYSVVQTNTYGVTSFTPGSLQPFSISTVASGANNFKTNGNGTTVVVWPFIVPGTTSDSAFTTVTVLPLLSGIEEQNEEFIREVVIQNPLNHSIKLVYDEKTYADPELISSDGKLLNGRVNDNVINVEKLPKGIYYVRFYHKTYDKLLTRKIIIN